MKWSCNYRYVLCGVSCIVERCRYVTLRCLVFCFTVSETIGLRSLSFLPIDEYSVKYLKYSVLD